MQKAIKKLFILGGIGTICALSLRMLQIVAISEAQTGFFSRDFAAFGTAISILIFAIIAAVGVYAISAKKTADFPMQEMPVSLPRKENILPLLTVMTTLSLICMKNS